LCQIVEFRSLLTNSSLNISLHNRRFYFSLLGDYTMKKDSSLTITELMSLDMLITVAQKRGRSLDDRLSSTEEQAEGMAEVHEAMWEARHGGLELSDHDREIFAKIRELASNLEIAPTLGELIELRGQALRGER
jgi:hypothetical protein